MSQYTRISYVIMALLVILAGALHLGTLLLTVLFGYAALQCFRLGRPGKYLALTVYLVVIAALGTGLIYFSRQAYVALPTIADTTIPAVVGFAEQKGIELPFSDYASLKTVKGS